MARQGNKVEECLKNLGYMIIACGAVVFPLNVSFDWYEFDYRSRYDSLTLWKVCFREYQINSRTGRNKSEIRCDELPSDAVSPSLHVVRSLTIVSCILIPMFFLVCCVEIKCDLAKPHFIASGVAAFAAFLHVLAPIVYKSQEVWFSVSKDSGKLQFCYYLAIAAPVMVAAGVLMSCSYRGRCKDYIPPHDPLKISKFNLKRYHPKTLPIPSGPMYFMEDTVESTVDTRLDYNIVSGQDTLSGKDTVFNQDTRPGQDTRPSKEARSDPNTRSVFLISGNSTNEPTLASRFSEIALPEN